MGHYVVLEAAALADAEAVAREAGDVVVLSVADREAAVAAVLAAVRGADLVVTATAKRDVIDQLCDDLRRLGTVEHRVEAAVRPAVTLSADERALLAALLGGASLGEAAAALHLSRRTADRRLATARRALGASSTAEALVLAAQAGVKPR
jgi:DNA-binding NarL/FixJ family response regulator